MLINLYPIINQYKLGIINQYQLLNQTKVVYLWLLNMSDKWYVNTLREVLGF